MIKLTPLTPAYILELDKLWKEHWSDTTLPDQSNSIIDSVVIAQESDVKRVIGYGQVKLFAEAMLFLDPTVRKKDRVRAVRLLMQEAFRGVDRVNVKNIYCFIKDPDFALLIEKHFGFDRVVGPGELLLKSLE